MTPRSQQGLPTIAEMVEGFPVSGRQLMTRVGDFFRVARTEVMQVPVWQDSHVTPPRSTTRSTGSPDGALGNLALGDGSLGSHGSSPPQVGSHGTPASFAPPPPGREGSLLSADVLQRMHALEQRAPHLYGQPFDRPQSRSNSSSLPQEAIQAEVARQLAGFDQRAQVQELEIQRLRRQLEEERVMREQAMREAALARNAPQVANPAPQQNPIPTQVAPPQEVQVPPQVTHQVQDVAQAVEAFRAQSAASAGRGLLSSLWSRVARRVCPKHHSSREGWTSASATWTIVWQHGSTNPTREGWDCVIKHPHSGTQATGSPGSSGIRLRRTGEQHFRRCNHVSLARRYSST